LLLSYLRSLGTSRSALGSISYPHAAACVVPAVPRALPAPRIPVTQRTQIHSPACPPRIPSFHTGSTRCSEDEYPEHNQLWSTSLISFQLRARQENTVNRLDRKKRREEARHGGYRAGYRDSGGDESRLPQLRQTQTYENGAKRRIAGLTSAGVTIRDMTRLANRRPAQAERKQSTNRPSAFSKPGSEAASIGG